MEMLKHESFRPVISAFGYLKEQLSYWLTVFYTIHIVCTVAISVGIRLERAEK